MSETTTDVDAYEGAGGQAEQPGLSRRVLLRGTLGGLGAAGLTACGGSGGSTSAQTATGAGAPGGSGSAAPSSAPPAPGAAASSTVSASAAGNAGQALVAASGVPVGGGVVLKDQRVVVTQPAAGQFNAFSAICTHQNCPVANVQDGTINCTCHGSKFSITDGSVKSPPAQQPLARIQVREQGGQVVRA